MNKEVASSRLLNRRQLRALIPASDMTIWRWQRANLFPLPININGRNYWRLDEIETWLRDRAVSRHVRVAS
jgi:predicted DNA-binding transcriptional regulator AlpA